MHILLLNIPFWMGNGGMCLPLGLLYVGSILERAGQEVEILDPYHDDVELTGFDQGNIF